MRDSAISPESEHVADLRDTIAGREAARFAAILERRWDEFEQLCHPDLRYVHATGVVDTRESYLAKLRGDHYDYRAITHDIDRIWTNERTVLVWGRMQAALRAGKVDKTIDNFVLSVWARIGEQWLLVAQQPTPEHAKQQSEGPR